MSRWWRETIRVRGLKTGRARLRWNRERGGCRDTAHVAGGVRSPVAMNTALTAWILPRSSPALLSHLHPSPSMLWLLCRSSRLDYHTWADTYSLQRAPHLVLRRRVQDTFKKMKSMLSGRRMRLFSPWRLSICHGIQTSLLNCSVKSYIHHNRIFYMWV